MQSLEPVKAKTYVLERFLAIVATVASLLISMRVWQVVSGQQDMWPLPGLYLIEIVALCITATVAIVRGASFGGILTWIVVGALGGFAVMGAWSIGPLFLPAAVIFAIIALSSDRRQKHSSVRHIGIAIVAGLVQAALMLIVVRLLYPSAIF